jgi:hypothetical protein
MPAVRAESYTLGSEGDKSMDTRFPVSGPPAGGWWRARWAVPALLVATLWGAQACGTEADPAARIVAEAIEVHGGARFGDALVTFRFRDDRIAVRRRAGEFRYERESVGPGGRTVREVMDNEGTWMEVDGARVPLAPDQRARTETRVNSVVYFAFLPFFLEDPAVVLRHLGEDTVEGEPYDRVEVTFRREGGGTDWEDRFVYWFHRDARTLDYLAYRYHRDGGGTRFRRAVNRREVGGLLLQDYENLAADPEIEDIAEYPRWLEEGRLRFVSMVELEDVEVSPTS